MKGTNLAWPLPGPFVYTDIEWFTIKGYVPKSEPYINNKEDQIHHLIGKLHEAQQRNDLLGAAYYEATLKSMGF